MDSLELASGDNMKSSRKNREAIKRNQSELNENRTTEQTDKEEPSDCRKNEAVTTKLIEDSENKLKERLAQCRGIIESLKSELSKEKTKLHKESKRIEEHSSFEFTSNVDVSVTTRPDSLNADFIVGDPYTSTIYSASVDNKLNCDESLIEYEKQLQRYQNTLKMAQKEKKNAIRKQMLAKAFKLKLLEVENQCNIELLRVKQSLQILEHLQMIASKWKTSADDFTYDIINFDLIPRLPELNANSGSDLNSSKDDDDTKPLPDKSGLCAKEDLLSPAE